MKQNRVRALVRILMVLALAVFGAGTASAQYGKIDGRVKTTDGKPVAAATVRVVGQPLTATTNKDGYYFFNNVPVGVYELSVTALTYTPRKVVDLRVVTNQTQNADFIMEPAGAVSLGEITATAAPPLVNPNKSTSMQTLDADFVKNLPEQRINTLLALQPGVSRPLNGDTTRLSIRGGRYTENIMYLDGIPQQRVTGNGIEIDIATNAFEDVSLITGAASAQFGNATAGVINISTRTGGSNYATSLQWETGMLGGSYATGNNNFQASFSGPLFLKGLTFSTTARLEGTAWSNNGYQGWLFPGYSTVGIDTTFTVPRTNTVVTSNPFNNSRADSAHFNVYKTAVISGDCDNFFFVKDASLQEMRDNYGVSCEKSRTFVSPRTQYLMNGSVSYQYGSGSRIRLSYNWNGTQSRPRLLQDGRATGTISNATSAAIAWNQTLFRKGTRSLNINASYSIQGNNSTSSPITVESEKSSRHPFSGFMLKKLDLVYGQKDFPIDSTIIKNFLTQTTYRSTLVPSSNANTGAQSIGSIGNWSSNTAGDIGDGVPYRVANGGGTDDVRGSGTTPNFNWNFENRKVATVNLDAQVDRWNRVTAQVQQTKTEAKTFNAGGTPAGSWYRPVTASASLEDKLDLSDVVLTAGVRWDYFNYHIRRWDNYPRISTMPGFDPLNPDQVMVNDKSHQYFAPRIQVAFPVTQQTNFRLSYSQSVQSAPFNSVVTRHQYDLYRSGTNNRATFGDDIGFSKVILFEFGVAHAFSDDMLLDVALYNRDNLANAQFKFAKRVDPLNGEPQQLYLLQNSDFGNARGIEISLDRRIGNYLNGRLNYAYADVKNTGSDPNSFLTFFEGIISGDGEPPATPLAVAQSTPHTLNGVVSIGLPADFKRGTFFGKVFSNTSASATFQLQSGAPYTRCDPLIQATQTTLSPTNTAGNATTCSSADAVQGYLASRLPMTKSLNTQFRRSFNVGKVSLSAFLNVNNILNLTNTKRVYATTGTTTNPLAGATNWRDDSTTFVSQATVHGFYAGNQMVLPTSTAGCAKVSNTTNSLVASCFYWIRSEQRFGNGDGVYTLDEWHRVSNLVHLPDTHISNFINGFRTMRFGVTVSF